MNQGSSGKSKGAAQRTAELAVNQLLQQERSPWLNWSQGKNAEGLELKTGL